MDFEKAKKYVGRPTILELEDSDGTKDKLEIYPLKGNDLVDLFDVYKSILSVFDVKDFKNIDNAELFDTIKNIDKETLKTYNYLVEKTIKKAIPKPESTTKDEYDEVIQSIMANNMAELAVKIFEINTFGIDKLNIDMPKIEKLKNNTKNGKDIKSN